MNKKPFIEFQVGADRRVGFLGKYMRLEKKPGQVFTDEEIKSMNADPWALFKRPNGVRTWSI